MLRISSSVACVQIDRNKDVLLETRHFRLVPVLPHLAVENREALVGAIFLELAQDAIRLRRRNAQDLLVGRRVQVDVNEYSCHKPLVS